LPPPTNPGDIIVVGQRRREPTEPFPERPQIVTFEGMFDELDPDLGLQPDPCADPAKALEWNADAAAAEALQDILDTIAAQNDSTHNLANREYGAMICEHSDGTLSISPIQWGDLTFDENGNWLNPGVQPTVDVNFNACGTGSLPLAMIHSHPGTGAGGGVPSASDVSWVGSINAARGDNLGRIYLVSIGDAETPYRIWVYDESNAEEASVSGEPGDEVNPDGQPCPGQVVT